MYCVSLDANSYHVCSGDDFFSIRAFAKLNEATLAMEDEDLKKVTASGGLDDDYIEYVINAPVDVDGVFVCWRHLSVTRVMAADRNTIRTGYRRQRI